eukprot:s3264_g3.t1
MGSNASGEVCDHAGVPNDEPGPCGFSAQDLFALGGAFAKGEPEETSGGMMQRWSDPDGDMGSGTMRGKDDGSWGFNGDNDHGIGKHRGQDAESCSVM